MNKQKLILILLIIISSCYTKNNKVENISYSDTSIDKATLFAEGIISSPENSEYSIDFTSDGKTAYFTRRLPEQKQQIYKSQFIEGNWTEPQLAPFSTSRDGMPSLTPDGKMFFFGSEREIPKRPNKGSFDMNIWMMEETKDGWSKPLPLPEPINYVQIEGEQWPSSNNDLLHTADNETFYFSTMKRGDSVIRAYSTKLKEGKFLEPIQIEGLFSDDKTWVYATIISPDNNYLVFNSYDAQGGAGGEDIFLSKKIGNQWSPAISIGDKINTTDHESFPKFSRDGKYFFFGKAESLPDYEYGNWNIYFIETKYLELDKLFKN